MSFDDFFGPPELRPGELHEPYAGPVSEAFREAMAARGVPISLAATVLAEYELVVAMLNSYCSIDELNARSRRVSVNSTRPLLASYIRTLLAVANGQQVDVPASAAVVVPSRLADRMRACDAALTLEPADLPTALQWELAAATTGQTMTEWALTQALDAGR
jgi:hypothetical protein